MKRDQRAVEVGHRAHQEDTKKEHDHLFKDPYAEKPGCQVAGKPKGSSPTSLAAPTLRSRCRTTWLSAVVKKDKTRFNDKEGS